MRMHSTTTTHMYCQNIQPYQQKLTRSVDFSPINQPLQPMFNYQNSLAQSKNHDQNRQHCGKLTFSKRSRTREAPTPTKSSTNSEAAQLKKGTPASPATALASRVFPVPGGPTSRQPLGILAPRAVYLSGFFKKSTTSTSSSLAPSTPCGPGIQHQ